MEEAMVTVIDRVETASFTWLHWVAGGLALLSGGIHLALGVIFWPQVTAIAFVLAGLGFVGGLILALLEYRRRQLYLAGIVFVTLQIVLYYWINYRADPPISPVEGIDKAVQVLLIVHLAVFYRREF